MTHDQRRFALIALLWGAFIFATSSGVVTVDQLSKSVSSVSGGKVSAQSFSSVWQSIWWIFVKGWHATEFALLAWLVGKVLPNKLALSNGLTLLCAMVDEVHQVFVPFRGGRFSDILIDGIGILLVNTWILKPNLILSRAQRIVLSVALFLLLFVFSVHPFGLMVFGSKPNHFAP